MIHWCTQASSRSGSGRPQGLLLLLLMAPALVAGPALASGALLLHSHGADGLHGHVHPTGITADVHEHAAHVDDHGHDLLHDSLHGHVPADGFHQLPAAVLPQPANARTAVTLERLLSLGGAGDQLPPTLEGDELETGQLPRLALRPPATRAPQGSGASRVLRLSHALLI